MEERMIYLTLENGQIFEGKSFGAYGRIGGEIVFTTAMTGYIETLTDPSFYGQVVVQTFPLIGNYGMIKEDFESPNPSLSAYIVRKWCQEPSNFRCEGDLDTFLKENNIIGLYDIDTRELTKIIREYGVMNAIITTSFEDAQKAVKDAKEMKISKYVPKVSCKTVSVTTPDEKKYRVVLWDFGAKANIRRELVKRGCEVITVPHNITAKEILEYKPDGIMLSNGPGDPADNKDIVSELAKLCEAKIPTFGICLGHQLLALSQGAKTEKLKYGHRGANQPVKDIETNRIYVTSQNHGYTVNIDSLPSTATANFINVNDNTCEGIIYHNLPAFSAQFHPESCAGPLDTEYMFDKFIDMMKGDK